MPLPPKQELLQFSAFILLSFFALLPALWFVLFGQLPTAWLREDGYYESIGAIACLIGSLAVFRAFLLSKKRDIKPDAGTGYSQWQQRLTTIWLFLFAAALLFLGGEEISWGQRILDFQAPESITAANFQNEFNLHNSMLIQSSNNLLSYIFTHLLSLYLMCLPIFLAAFPSAAIIFARTRIPIPSLAITFTVVIAKLANALTYKLVYGNTFLEDSLHIGEAYETILQICLVWVAFECLALWTKHVGNGSNVELTGHNPSVGDQGTSTGYGH